MYQPLPNVPQPPENLPSPEKIRLGKKLFFDPVLSGDNRMSCSTCHVPEKGWADQRSRAVGHGGKVLSRNTPTVLNSGYPRQLFWDGRVSSLEEQALIPIQSPVEMNQPLDDLIGELQSIPEYRDLFRAAFGDVNITAKRISKALACFERTLVTGKTPFDRYWEGDRDALSPSAIRGMNLFFGKAKCSICHNGARFTDDQFHNIGVPDFPAALEDKGRFQVTGEKFHHKAFRTPGLRSLKQQAPYMHNGIFKTLQEVIDFYDSGGADDPVKSPFITPIGLNRIEKEDLIEFLNSLEPDPH